MCSCRSYSWAWGGGKAVSALRDEEPAKEGKTGGGVGEGRIQMGQAVADF